jgi:hypothetical protein
MFNSNYRRGTSGCRLPVCDSFETIRVPLTVETLGEGAADAASNVTPRSASSFGGEAACADPETANAQSSWFDYDVRPL